MQQRSQEDLTGSITDRTDWRFQPPTFQERNAKQVAKQRKRKQQRNALRLMAGLLLIFAGNIEMAMFSLWALVLIVPGAWLIGTAYNPYYER